MQTSTKVFQFFTMRISDRSVRSDRSRSGLLLLAMVCVNYLTMYRNLASTGILNNPYI